MGFGVLDYYFYQKQISSISETLLYLLILNDKPTLPVSASVKL
jgi:hypothetical protein